MNFEFDENEHIYKLEGVVIPGVTSIIADAGMSNVNRDDPAVMAAGLFGTATHKATELKDKGTLDESTVDPEIRPYLDAWEDCKLEFGLKIIENELKLYHPIHLFAGTMDRVVEWNGNKNILDIKTSADFPAHVGVQLSAYQNLYNHDKKRSDSATGKIAVLLRKDGTYKFRAINNRLDWPTFLSALTLFNWKNNNLK